MTTEQKFLSPCFVMYGKTEIKGLKLGEYSHLWELRKSPLFACLLGNQGTISKTTRQKDGIVYIPWTELSSGLKFKVIHGKGYSFYYEIWKIINIEEYCCNVQITRYERQTRASYIEPTASNEVYTDAVPF